MTELPTLQNPDFSGYLHISFETQLQMLKMYRDIMGSHDMEQILTLTLNYIKESIGADIAQAVITNSGTVFTPNPQDNFSGEHYRKIPKEILLESGITGLAYTHRRTIAVSDYWNSYQFEHHAEVDEAIKESGAVAVISVPIITNDEVVALFGLAKTRAYHWTEQDLRLCQQFSEVVGMAIHNLNMYNSLQELNRQFISRNRQLEALQVFSHQLHSLVEIKAAAERALALTTEAVEADGGSIHMLDPHHPDMLDLIITIARRPENPSKFAVVNHEQPLFVIPDWLKRVKVGEGMLGSTAATRQTVLINNVPEKVKDNPQALVDPAPEWKSGLSVPLLYDDELLGVLSIVSYQPNRFDAEKVGFAEALASQVAGAFARIKRGELQRQRDQLAAILTLARTAAHDLSQPLTLLQIELDMAEQLGQRIEGETLAMMQRAVGGMTATLREYQEFARFETTEPTPGFSIIDRDKAL